VSRFPRMNAAKLLVRCLDNEGVDYIFGIPGETARACARMDYFICNAFGFF
jgi:hypothetical protein